MPTSRVFMVNRTQRVSVQSLRRVTASLGEALQHPRDPVERMLRAWKVYVTCPDVGLSLFAFTDLCDNLARDIDLLELALLQRIALGMK